jgi:hypothetical protein
MGMLCEHRYRLGMKRHACERRIVVKQHRHGRAIGDLTVMTDERLCRKLRFEERRRAHEHGIGARRGRSLRELDRLARRFAAGARDEHAIARHGVARCRNRALRFLVANQRRFAVRAEHHDAAKRRAKHVPDVVLKRGKIHGFVGGERRRHRREDA